MKRFTYMILSAAIAGLVACGPSAEEKEAAEKAKQDSIAAAQKMIDDSISAVAAMEKAMQDSTIAAERAKSDSITAASEAAAKKKARPKTNEQKMEEDRKVQKKEKG